MRSSSPQQLSHRLTHVLAQVIVTRKVLLMSTFLLFEPLFAVLLATGLVMVSIGIHIYARPFEDAGTNWVEMLTLTSQLFLLVAGPVFKTLVRDRCARPAREDREALGNHRRHANRTTRTTAWTMEWRPRSGRASSLSAPERSSRYDARRSSCACPASAPHARCNVSRHSRCRL